MILLLTTMIPCYNLCGTLNFCRSVGLGEMMIPGAMKKLKKQMVCLFSRSWLASGCRERWDMIVILQVRSQFRICLGHCHAEVLVGKLGLAPKVMHGKQSHISFEAPSASIKALRMVVQSWCVITVFCWRNARRLKWQPVWTGWPGLQGIQHKSLPFMVCSIIQKYRNAAFVPPFQFLFES